MTPQGVGDTFRVWGVLATGHDETAPPTLHCKDRPLTAPTGPASISSSEQKHVGCAYPARQGFRSLGEPTVC